ncbi:nuclear transport factor 2 (NTF2) domain-containing protein [Ditylenchus destructor]|nr:nuclear transport factor 2 (NTF2) domain-containing protein [Ditylenchus destructor]
MSSSIAAKSKVDEEICAEASKFVGIYNDCADLRRNRIGLLYTANEASLIWNGNPVKGVSDINAFWNNLPSTQHEISCLDAHPMETNNKSIVAQILGNVSLGGISRAYSQVLILVYEDGNYKIKSDCYRFIE